MPKETRFVDCKYRIRYHSFGINFLTNEVANSGLLTDKEVISLIQLCCQSQKQYIDVEFCKVNREEEYVSTNMFCFVNCFVGNN